MNLNNSTYQHNIGSFYNQQGEKYVSAKKIREIELFLYVTSFWYPLLCSKSVFIYSNPEKISLVKMSRETLRNLPYF